MATMTHPTGDADEHVWSVTVVGRYMQHTRHRHSAKWTLTIFVNRRNGTASMCGSTRAGNWEVTFGRGHCWFDPLIASGSSRASFVGRSGRSSACACASSIRCLLCLWLGLLVYGHSVPVFHLVFSRRGYLLLEIRIFKQQILGKANKIKQFFQTCSVRFYFDEDVSMPHHLT